MPSTLTFRTSFRNVIYDVLRARGWRETEAMDWDFHWAEKEWVTEFMDGIHLNPCGRRRPFFFFFSPAPGTTAARVGTRS